jgi:amidase
MLGLLAALDGKIVDLDKEIARRTREDEVPRRLMTVPGIVAISATAIVALAAPAETFAKGRRYFSQSEAELRMANEAFGRIQETIVSDPPGRGKLRVSNFNPSVPDWFDNLWRNFAFTPLANLCGIPAISLPLGIHGNGLPLGIQAQAKQANDGLLLQLAAQIDRAIGGPVECWAQAGRAREQRLKGRFDERTACLRLRNLRILSRRVPNVSARYRGSNHILKAFYHLLHRKRLLEEPAVCGSFVRGQFCSSRYQNDLDGRPAVMDGLSEPQTVHAAGHLDVREKQRYVRAAFQYGNRFVRIHRFDGRKPGVGDDVCRTHSQHLIVFHD